MGQTAYSMNIVLSSAIRGSTFLQASIQGIYKYASSLQNIKLLGATKFGLLNNNVRTLDNNLARISTRVNTITSRPIRMDINRDGLSRARRDINAIENSLQRASQLSSEIRISRQSQPQQRAMAMTQMVGGIGIGSMITIPFKASIDFESSIARVGALANIEKTSKEFELLNKTALNLGASTEWSATQIAEGMQFLTMGQVGSLFHTYQ